MKKMTKALALLILCFGLVASAVDHEEGLENYLNIPDENDGLKKQYDDNSSRGQRLDYLDHEGNPVYDELDDEDPVQNHLVQNGKLQDGRIQMDPLENMITMLTHGGKREMLKRIAQRMKNVFVDTADTDKVTIGKIMENLKKITNENNGYLIDEIVEGWETAMETPENKDLIREVQSLLDFINENEHVQETVRVVHAGLQNIFNDKVAPRLIDASVRIAHKAVEMRENIQVIVQEAFAILKDERKMTFIKTMVQNVAPIMGTLKMMVGTSAFDQRGTPATQSFSPALNPQTLFNMQSTAPQSNVLRQFNGGFQQ